MSNYSSERPVRRRKRKLKVFNLILTILLTGILLCATIGIFTVLYVINTATEIDPTNIHEMLNNSTFVYDYSGRLLEKVSNQKGYREIISLDEIPKDMKNAVVAIEDERFYEHNGLDLKRVGGALLHNITTRSLGQGASTITMQLSKNLYTTSEKSFKRKIQDAYYAVEIEKQLGKDDILLAYLNVADFSRNTKGIQAAAHTFFNKNVSELTLGECAMLAGVPRRPSYYSPYSVEELQPGDDIAKLQLLTILNTKDKYVPTEQELSYYHKAYGMGKIDRFMLVQLKQGDYYLRKAVLNPNAKKRQSVVLKKMLELGYITEEQRIAAEAEDIQIKVGKRKEQGISSYFTDILKDEVIRALVADGFTQEEAEQKFMQGGLRIYSTLNLDVQRKLEKVVNNPDNYSRAYIDSEGIVQPQVSMVIMKQGSGEVRALVGGRGIGGASIYNRAINPRQPGSAIKPIAVYAPALENGMTAASIFNDSPRYDESLKKMWPKNSTGYMGKTTLRNLLIRSSNVGAVEVASNIIPGSKQASIREMVRSLQGFGITTVVTSDKDPKRNDEHFSLALGGMTYGISPLEITAAYAAISNAGVYTKPVFFTRIEDSRGNIILESKPKSRNVMSPANAYILQNMLYGVVNSTKPRGTGVEARLHNMTTAGKTGTTTDKKDVWFVGMTPYYTAGLWIGSDKPRELPEGSSMAARLWKQVMDEVHEGLENKPFAKPSDVVSAQVSHTSGLLSNQGYEEYFKQGTEPTSYSSDHQEEELLPDDEDLTELHPEETSGQGGIRKTPAEAPENTDDSLF